MTAADVDRLLAEARLARAEHAGADEGDADLAPLRWAILIEDAFGVTLTDEQLTGLRDEASARSLLDRLTQG